MPERQQTSLKFPLEESVWFEKGQEVDELISISLDPHITVLDENEFVVLKGTLELSGEYKHLSDHTVTESSDLKRTYIQTVELRNETESEFSHHFPVDITVPRSRIANIEEMEVVVQSFDYELPESDRLRLIADVHIHGIYEEIANENEEELERKDTQANDNIEIEERVEQEEIQVISNNELEDDTEEDMVEVVLQQVSEKDENEVVANLREEEEQEEEELYEPFVVEARTIPQGTEKQKNKVQSIAHIPELPELSPELVSNRTIDNREPDNEQWESSIEPFESSTYYESSSSIIEAKQQEKKKKKKDKYKSMSFADFFARKEEETLSKMRICLVQQGDTIQELAEKYDVSVQQILRANHLEASHEVYGGQVLYIPSKTVSPFKRKQ